MGVLENYEEDSRSAYAMNTPHFGNYTSEEMIKAMSHAQEAAMSGYAEPRRASMGAGVLGGGMMGGGMGGGGMDYGQLMRQYEEVI